MRYPQQVGFARTALFLAVFCLGLTGLSTFSPVTTVKALAPLQITTLWSSVPAGLENTAYSFTFGANGGVPPYTWSMSGSIPGLNLSSSGVLSGTPTTAGSYSVTISVRDDDSPKNTASLGVQTFVVQANTATTITSVSTRYSPIRAGYPVWVAFQVTSSSTSSEEISGSVTVTANEASCSGIVDSTGNGECALFFSSSGAKSITAAYNGNTYYRSSSSAGVNRSVDSFSADRVLSAGRRHTCYLNTNGDLDCWGAPNYSTDALDQPVTEHQVALVSSGSYHTCAIKTDGSLACWGDNPAVVAVPTGKYVEISAGGDFACALNDHRQVVCWGTLPAGLSASPGSGQYTAITSGSNHACALRRDSAFADCWGLNPNSLFPPSNIALSEISAGHAHTCGKRISNGLLSCWGNAPSLTPPSTTGYSHLGVGSSYACAMNASNRLICWGANAPPVDTTSVFLNMSVGFLHTCALKSSAGADPYLACWGQNSEAQAPRLTLSPASDTLTVAQNKAYSRSFTPQGGFVPYTLALTGEQPAGLTLSGSTLAGTPTTADTYDYAIVVNESYPGSGLPLELNPLSQAYRLIVESPATSASFFQVTPTADAGSPVTVVVTVNKSSNQPLTGLVQINGGDPDTTCSSAVGANQRASCVLFFETPGTKTIQAFYEGDSFHNSSAVTSTTVVITAVTLERQISSGNQFSCASNTSGLVRCWGVNDSGQSIPRTGIYSSFSAGMAHVCARRLNGIVECWGWNGYSVGSPPVSGVSAVSSGYAHSCGLLGNGSVVCWGYNSNGQAEDPSGTFSAVTSGAFHNCALTPVGSVTCWGRSGEGQLAAPAVSFSAISAGGSFTCGIKQADSSLACWGGNGVIDAIRTPPSGAYKFISAGEQHACAINSSDHAVCWGDTTSGATLAPAPTTFTRLASGYDHTCGIASDGTLECWGNNNFGQAPLLTFDPLNLTTIDVEAPYLVDLQVNGAPIPTYDFNLVNSTLPTGLDYESASGKISGTPTQAGIYSFTMRAVEHSINPAFAKTHAYNLVIRSKVSVGLTSVTPSSPMAGRPTSLQVQVTGAPPGMMGAHVPGGNVTLTTSDGLSCQVVLVNGVGSCTLVFPTSGDKTIQLSYPGDDYFMPGSNTGAPSHILLAAYQQPVSLFTGSDRTFLHNPDGSLVCLGAGCLDWTLPAIYPGVGAGNAFACVIQSSGTVVCKTNQQPAVEYAGQFSGLSVGRAHACALDPQGFAQCWGESAFGKTAPPTSAFNQLSAGGEHTCGLRQDGSLTCWGSSASGQITAPSGNNFSSLSSGGNHSCALRSDGSLACWGSPSSGQNTPPAGSGYSQVSSGANHSCALDSSGRAVCWGDNSAGQTNVPYGVFTRLASYGNHTCGLRSSLGLTCWGDNQNGEAPRILYTPPPVTSLPALAYWEHDFQLAGGSAPYFASIVSGALPQGMTLGFRLTPAGLLLYGAPQVPGQYSFTIRREDSSTTPLVDEEPLAMTITGGDLKVQITPLDPSGALYQNPYQFLYTLSNQTSLDVPSVRFSADVSAGMSGLLVSADPGASCNLVQNHLECTIATLPALSSLSVRLNGTVEARPGELLETSAQINPTLSAWPEIYTPDNTASASVKVALETLAYQEAFESSPITGWVNGAMVVSPDGVHYWGDFGGSQSTRLVVNNLASHKRLTLSFDLYVIGPWMGNQPGGEHRWMLSETGGAAWLETTFSNTPGMNQAFPGWMPGGSYPARTGAAALDQLGYPATPDTRYHLTLDMEHTGNVLDLTFQSLSLPAGVTWGLDNVKVLLGSGWRNNYLPGVQK